MYIANKKSVGKVWGTMKTCSSGAVAATIARLCPEVAGKIQLHGKYKTNESGRTTWWWFIIKGKEKTLTELQEMWEGVFNQTAWKLEYCYMSKKSVIEGSQAVPSSPGAKEDLCPQAAKIMVIFLLHHILLPPHTHTRCTNITVSQHIHLPLLPLLFYNSNSLQTFHGG